MNRLMNRREAMRRLLNWFSLGMAGLAGAVVSVPLIAYIFSPLIKPSQNIWQDIGPFDNFVVGKTVEVSFQDPSPLAWAGQTAKTAAWVRRNDQSTFTVFAINCTHLGCPVNWVEGAQLFFCPCHGGVYYSNGEVAGGPPPRHLFHYDWRIENGSLLIKTRNLPIV